MDADAARRRLVGDARFELVERLGTGAMGTVWRAVDTMLQREVALKEVRVRDGADDEEIALLHARALREAQALARLRHPHVATVYQIIDDVPFPWIVMELVPGRSLTDLLSDGTLGPRKAAGIGADVLDALAAAHAAGILHRDVKPANVLVRPDDRAVLVDFGIAAVEGSAAVTGIGSFLGTIDYIAPERAAEGGSPSPASDLWSLGVMLYVAVEGASPFRRDNHWATIAAIVNEPHPPLRNAGELAAVIDALLAKDPQERPTAEELAGPLAAIAGRAHAQPTVAALPHLGDLPTVAGETPAGPTAGPSATHADPRPPRRTRRRVVAAAIGTLLVAGGAAAGIALALSENDNENGGKPNSQSTPTQTPPATPTGAPTSQLPAGYQLQSHASGFQIAVPDGWQLGQDTSGNIAYVAPGGNARLVVRVLRGDGADPYAEQKRSADESKASAAYPGYRQIELTQGTLRGNSSATWEYRYNAAEGPRHIKDVRWRVGGNSYNLWIAVPDGPSWPQYAEQLDIALAHFKDTP